MSRSAAEIADAIVVRCKKVQESLGRIDEHLEATRLEIIERRHSLASATKELLVEIEKLKEAT